MATPSARRSRPRRRASVSTARRSLVPSTSTTPRSCITASDQDDDEPRRACASAREVGAWVNVSAVLTNRSAPPATVTPVLVYPDVRAAVAWLEAAFGFEERVRIGDAHRAQMRVGLDGAVVVADVGADRI